MNGQRDSTKTVHLYQIKVANLVYSDYKALREERILTDSTIKNLYKAITVRDSIAENLFIRLHDSEEQAKNAISKTNRLQIECSIKDKKLANVGVTYKVGGGTIVLLLLLLLL